jgi:hypothetical protein
VGVVVAVIAFAGKVDARVNGNAKFGVQVFAAFSRQFGSLFA